MKLFDHISPKIQILFLFHQVLASSYEPVAVEQSYHQLELRYGGCHYGMILPGGH
jgi:hypothetical protein